MKLPGKVERLLTGWEKNPHAVLYSYDVRDLARAVRGAFSSATGRNLDRFEDAESIRRFWAAHARVVAGDLPDGGRSARWEVDGEEYRDMLDWLFAETGEA